MVENLINATQYMFAKTNLVKFNVIFFDRIASWFGKSSKAWMVEFCMVFAFLQCDILITASKPTPN